MLGCEVVLRQVPGFTASDLPGPVLGWLLRVIGLYVMMMSVSDSIDPAHLYPPYFLMEGGPLDQL